MIRHEAFLPNASIATANGVKQPVPRPGLRHRVLCGTPCYGLAIAGPLAWHAAGTVAWMLGWLEASCTLREQEVSSRLNAWFEFG